MMELSTIIQALVAIFGVFAWTAGMIKYLVDRMDRGDNTEREKREAAMKDVTKRPDFERHVEHTERQLSEIRNDIKLQQTTLVKAINDLGVQVSTRLDNLMLSLNNRANDK